MRISEYTIAFIIFSVVLAVALLCSPARAAEEINCTCQKKTPYPMEKYFIMDEDGFKQGVQTMEACIMLNLNTQERLAALSKGLDIEKSVFAATRYDCTCGNRSNVIFLTPAYFNVINTFLSECEKGANA